MANFKRLYGFNGKLGQESDPGLMTPTPAVTPKKIDVTGSPQPQESIRAAINAAKLPCYQLGQLTNPFDIITQSQPRQETSSESFANIASGISSILTPLANTGAQIYQLELQRKLAAEQAKGGGADSAQLALLQQQLYQSQAQTRNSSSSTPILVVALLALLGILFYLVSNR